MKGQEQLFSSKSDSWETPNWLFDELNKEFNFTLDPCSSNSNRKTSKYYTIVEDGLTQDWLGETVFVNPPYSKVEKWVAKCYEQWKNGVTVVMLLPSRTSNKWFHKYIYNQEGVEIRFVKGRIVFEIDGKPVLDKKGNKMCAPFPTMIVVFNKSLELPNPPETFNV